MKSTESLRFLLCKTEVSALDIETCGVLLMPVSFLSKGRRTVIAFSLSAMRCLGECVAGWYKTSSVLYKSDELLILDI